MKQHVKYKSIILFINFVLLMGCGNPQKPSAFTDVTPAESDYGYLAEFIDFANTDLVNDACVIENDLYIVTVQEEELRSNLFTIDLQQRVLKPVKAFYKENEQSIISRITVDNENHLVMLEKSSAAKENGEKALGQDDANYKIKIWDMAEENLVSQVDITDFMRQQPKDFVSGFNVDKDGNFYLAIGKNVYALDSDGKQLFEIHPNMEYFIDFSITGSGQPVILTYSGENGGLSMSLIGADEGGIIKTYADLDAKPSGKLASAKGEAVYTEIDGIIYLCDIEENTREESFRWVDSRINSSEVKYYAPFGEEQFVAVVSEQMGSVFKTRIAFLSKVPRSEIPSQKKLVLATFGATRDLQDAVAYFNSIQDECQVEIKDYYVGNPTREEAKNLYQQMLLDIMSGEEIDIFHSVRDYHQLVAAGLIENLYPYLENDPELKNVEFFQSVLDEQAVEGVLTNIPSFFYIETKAGREADFGTVDEGITMDEVRILMAQQPAGKELGIYRNQLLNTLFFNNYKQFIDWETGECYMDSQQFIELLEFSKKYGLQQPFTGDLLEKQDNFVLQSCDVFNGLYYGLVDCILEEPAVYKGDPVWTKESSNGASIISSSGCSIAAKSEDKEDAWQFIRCFLLQEYYDNVIAKTGIEYIYFPIRKDIYDKAFEEWMTTETIVDDNGVERTVSKYDIYLRGEPIRLPVTAEDKEAVTNLIEFAGRGATWNPEIWEIIEEEATPFFEGQKSAQDVAKIMQSRVQLYVSENM